MYCSNCGEEIFEESKFCPKCGNKMDLEEENVTANAEEEIVADVSSSVSEEQSVAKTLTLQKVNAILSGIEAIVLFVLARFIMFLSSEMKIIGIAMILFGLFEIIEAIVVFISKKPIEELSGKESKKLLLKIIGKAALFLLVFIILISVGFFSKKMYDPVIATTQFTSFEINEDVTTGELMSSNLAKCKWSKEEKGSGIYFVYAEGFSINLKRDLKVEFLYEKTDSEHEISLNNIYLNGSNEPENKLTAGLIWLSLYGQTDYDDTSEVYDDEDDIDYEMQGDFGDELVEESDDADIEEVDEPIYTDLLDFEGYYEGEYYGISFSPYSTAMDNGEVATVELMSNEAAGESQVYHAYICDSFGDWDASDYDYLLNLDDEYCIGIIKWEGTYLIDFNSSTRNQDSLEFQYGF